MFIRGTIIGDAWIMKRIHRLALIMFMLVIIDELAFRLYSTSRISGLHLGIMSAILTWALENK